MLDGRLKARPAGVLPAELEIVIYNRAVEIITLLRAEQESVLTAQALELLKRLKGYIVPSGQMKTARNLTVRIRGITDPIGIVMALKNFEQQLITLGADYDPQLAETVDVVGRSFPDARLIK